MYHHINIHDAVMYNRSPYGVAGDLEVVNLADDQLYSHSIVLYQIETRARY